MRRYPLGFLGLGALAAFSFGGMGGIDSPAPVKGIERGRAKVLTHKGGKIVQVRHVEPVFGGSVPNRYVPHQGERECARRRGQMSTDVLWASRRGIIHRVGAKLPGWRRTIQAIAAE